MIPGIQAGLYIDYMDNGTPYLGVEFSGGGASVRLFLCEQAAGGAFETGVIKAVENLRKTPRRIAGADGSTSASVRNP